MLGGAGEARSYTTCLWSRINNFSTHDDSGPGWSCVLWRDMIVLHAACDMVLTTFGWRYAHTAGEMYGPAAGSFDPRLLQLDKHETGFVSHPLPSGLSRKGVLVLQIFVSHDVYQVIVLELIVQRLRHISCSFSHYTTYIESGGHYFSYQYSVKCTI